MKLKDIRLIACDMDGTLLNDDKELTSYTQKVLGQAAKKGYVLCIASGRHEAFLSYYEKQLNCCHFVISCNGAVVRSSSCMESHREEPKNQGAEKVEKFSSMKGEVWNRLLTEEESRGAVAFFEARGLPYLAYTKDQLYYSPHSTAIWKMMQSYEALAQAKGYPLTLPKIPFSSPEELPFGEMVKIAGYELGEEEERALIAWANESRDLMAEKAGQKALAILSKRTTKGVALAHLGEHLQIDPSQMMVFGDYENDISLFEHAKYSFAMENSVLELKRQAWKIIGSNNEDAVAKTIEEYLF